MKKKNLKVASFFTGIGGFDYAFEQLKMQIIFQCEINPYCQSILKKKWANYPFEKNVEEVKLDQISKADLWCAGFPCQDLSSANQGKRKGLDGKRSGLFHRFADLLENLQAESRPAWIILENVPGLLNSHEGGDFQIVLKRINKLGYCLSWRTLDAKYFGTPQRRRRVFMVGSLGSMNSIYALFDKIDIETVYKQSLGFKDILESICLPNENVYVFQHASIGRKPEAGPQAKGFRNDGETYTLDSRGSSDVIVRIDRAFQIEPGDITYQIDSNRYRAIGNAVNTHVIKWIGKRILEAERCKSLKIRLDWKVAIKQMVNKRKFKGWTGINKNETRRWDNSGVMYKGKFVMGNLLEHGEKTKPKLAEISEFINESAPLNYFLPIEQLKSMIERANAKKRPLPTQLEEVIRGQIVALSQYPEFNEMIKSKQNIQNLYLIPLKLLTALKVRRMTPGEYEKLQGFPIGWTSSN